MSVVSCTIFDLTLSEHGIVIVNELDFATRVEFMHDLALSSPDLLAAPVAGTMTLCTSCRWDLENVHLAFLHESDFNLINLIPNV